MKIAMGSDHGGFALKEEIKNFVMQQGHTVEDVGTYDTDSCNYAEYGYKVAKKVAMGACERGIVVCGTGIGISIAANKVKGIRAALCSDEFSAEMTRLHNDANILALGQRVVGVGLALNIVKKFLDTDFEGGRHTLRVETLSKIENME